VNKKDKARAKRLWDNYKLTLDQYDAILTFQGGVCYGCQRPEPVKGRSLAVDHDHATGLVRGLLCSRCNPVLGKIERAFIRYGLGKVLDLTMARWILRMSGYVNVEPASKALGYKHIGYSGRTGTKAHRARLRRERKNGATPHPSNTEE
jgi:Recombination endonuclease VII